MQSARGVKGDGLKTVGDLLTIGVDPRDILAIGFRKQMEIHKAMSEDFPGWPDDPPVNRLFHGLCEVLFPSEGHGAKVPAHTRIMHALAVVARTREGVLEVADRMKAEARSEHAIARARAATGAGAAAS